MDTLTRDERSRLMGRVRSRDTSPELAVRRLLHALGYRYRLHARALPGRPDIVFSARRKVIFIHGCFWHQHLGCAGARVPKSNVAFWTEKFHANRARDKRAVDSLRAADWDVCVLWECELGDAAALARALGEFLGPVKFGRVG
jgi:DNA mismatch endonuclease (patch repair protein)